MYKADLPYSASPKSVSISITGRCNLSCKYCFYADEMTALKDLETKNWLNFFSELKEIGVMDVGLTGGEAFTRSDLFELIDGIIDNKMRYSILTNGTLINENIVEEFSKGKRRKRLNFIQISIDGSTAAIHNKNRPGSFDKALSGLKILKAHGFPIAVRATINKHNLFDLENIAYLLLEEIGLPNFSTNEAMPIGSGCRNADEVSLDSSEKLEAMKIIKKLTEKYPGRLLASAGPQANIKVYQEIEQSKDGIDIFPTRKLGFLSACGCVFARIDILHDGTIVPCCMLSGVTLGNIQKDSLSDIWQNHPILKNLRERMNIPMHSVEGCEDCEWNKWCNGSCPGTAHHLTGEYNSANPEDCFKKFLRENNIPSTQRPLLALT